MIARGRFQVGVGGFILCVLQAQTDLPLYRDIPIVLNTHQPNPVQLHNSPIFGLIVMKRTLNNKGLHYRIQPDLAFLRNPSHACLLKIAMLFDWFVNFFV